MKSKLNNEYKINFHQPCILTGLIPQYYELNPEYPCMYNCMVH